MSKTDEFDTYDYSYDQLKMLQMGKNNESFYAIHLFNDINHEKNISFSEGKFFTILCMFLAWFTLFLFWVVTAYFLTLYYSNILFTEIFIIHCIIICVYSLIAIGGIVLNEYLYTSFRAKNYTLSLIVVVNMIMNSIYIIDIVLNYDNLHDKTISKYFFY